MTAREYLQKLQLDQIGGPASAKSYDQRVRSLYLDRMNRATPEYRKLLEENLRKRDASDAKYLDRLPTPFQSLQDFRRLTEAKERIDVMLRRVGQFEPLDNLILGSIETEKLNAMSAPWNGEYLVVFNRGLLLALLAVSNLVTCAFTQNWKPQSGIAVDSIDLNTVLLFASRFFDVLDSVSHGHAPTLETIVPLLKWPEKEIRWTKLEDAATEFVFAHEYAHILLGHLSDAAEQDLTEDQGGWGREYQADSLALDFVAQTWLEEERIGSGANFQNPLLLAFVLQGVCLFFTMMCQIEQYSAETLGKSAGIWSDSKSHPPTFIRWVRMLDKVRQRTPDELWTQVITPQLIAILQCLSLYYSRAVPERAPDVRTVEWRFQRAALEALGGNHLVPQHLFIAMRCARAALVRGASLDETEVDAIANQADVELEAGGARPLRDYRQLAAVTPQLSERALVAAQTAGAEVVRKFADRLADIFFLDARTRYPLVANADTSSQ